MSITDRVRKQQSTPKGTLLLFDAHATDLMKFKSEYQKLGYVVVAILVTPTPNNTEGADLTVSTPDEVKAIFTAARNEPGPKFLLTDGDMRSVPAIGTGEQIIRWACEPSMLPDIPKVLHTSKMNPMENYTRSQSRHIGYVKLSKQPFEDAQNKGRPGADVYFEYVRTKVPTP